MHTNREALSIAVRWEEKIDAFLAAVEPDEPESFFPALTILREVDTLSMASDIIAHLARVYIAASPEKRNQLELDRRLPIFGHVIVARSEHATVSVSVRAPRPAMAMNVLSTSNCHEYHRVERGSVRISECAFAGERDGRKTFFPSTETTLGVGEEIVRRADEAAFVFNPVAPCLILSAAGAIMGDFKTNLDARTGMVLGQSFNNSRDSILVNVLELCAEFPDPAVSGRCAAYLTHRNYRVRLAALKACLMNDTESVPALARKASMDMHPAIADMGKHLLELVQ